MIEGMSALTGHKDSKVLPVQKEIEAILASLDRPDLLVVQEIKDQRVIPASLDQLEPRELSGLRDLLAQLDQLEAMVLKEIQVLLVPTEGPASRVIQVMLVRKDLQEL